MKIQEVRGKLIEYLKTCDINGVLELWNQTKVFARDHKLIFGGSYASWQDFVSLNVLNKNKEAIRFNVNLSEVKVLNGSDPYEFRMISGSLDPDNELSKNTEIYNNALPKLENPNGKVIIVGTGGEGFKDIWKSNNQL